MHYASKVIVLHVKLPVIVHTWELIIVLMVSVPLQNVHIKVTAVIQITQFAQQTFIVSNARITATVVIR